MTPKLADYIEAGYEVVSQRVNDLLTGKVKSVSGQESFDRIRARLDALHE
ncbi:hypothetical protein [Propionimicrobium sp. PCR01-08-3]|nr:hypothetical protein [Propionimicrobium sp. PCR01-08-3]WIY82140.1 hypothetical protein QQ658_11595 [Propionimicrobium sp. PCR01-08-3]